MRAALLSVLIGVALMAGLIGVFMWSPWSSEGRQHERTWLRSLDEWRSADGGRHGRRCLRTFAARVGRAPTERMKPVASAVRDWCRGSGWEAVESSLVAAHSRTARAAREVDLSGIASSISGVKTRVYCWPERDWTPSPDVCDPLRRFLRGAYQPYLNTQSYELAEAIVTLAHESEHLRTPGASEAVVECHALQRARALVRLAGRKPWYQKEMAGLAWEVGYPQQFADYRTKACRNGGPLDLHPGSNAWP